jgi:hypothetical protein
MHSFNLPILAEFSSQSLSPWSFNRQIVERLEATDLSSKSRRILCRCHKGCALQLLFGSLVRCPAILGCQKGPGGRVLATRPRRLQRGAQLKDGISCTSADPTWLFSSSDCLSLRKMSKSPHRQMHLAALFNHVHLPPSFPWNSEILRPQPRLRRGLDCASALLGYSAPTPCRSHCQIARPRNFGENLLPRLWQCKFSKWWRGS